MPRRAPRSSNPAQRLYAILKRHTEVAEAGEAVGYSTVWCRALEVEAGEVAEHIADAFGLIGEVRRALEATGDEMLLDQFNLHKESWAHAFVPTSSGWHQQLNGGTVEAAALSALGGIGSHLAVVAYEGKMPSGDERSELRDLVQDAIDAVLDDESLDDKLADVLVRRLYDMMWALDYLRIKGPDGIAAACDRLVVALNTAGQDLVESDPAKDSDDQRSRRAVLDKVAHVVGRAVEIVQMPGAVYGTYAAMAELAPAVSSAVGQITQ